MNKERKNNNVFCSLRH